MEHTWSRKEDHRLVRLQRALVEGTDMCEVKHILLDERLLDLFVGPVDEQLVVKVCFFGQATRKIDWIREAGPIPVGFKQNTEFLGSAECKDWDQDLAALVESLVDLTEEFALPAALRVSDCGGVGRLSEDDVGAELVDPGRTQMSICTHVVVTSIHETLSVTLDVKHGGPEDMARVVGGHFNFIVAKRYRLVQLDRSYLINTVPDHFLVKAVNPASLRH